MSNKEARDFERLLYRTENLSDQTMISENLGFLNSKLESLRTKSVYSNECDKNFMRRINILQEKCREKVEVVPKKALFSPRKAQTMGNQTERQKHETITNSIVNLTGQLKENISKVGVAAKVDAEVLKEVHTSISETTEKAQQDHTDIEDTSSKSIGFRAYVWLGTVIVVYLLVSFLFT